MKFDIRNLWRCGEPDLIRFNVIMWLSGLVYILASDIFIFHSEGMGSGILYLLYVIVICPVTTLIAAVLHTIRINCIALCNVATPIILGPIIMLSLQLIPGSIVRLFGGMSDWAEFTMVAGGVIILIALSLIIQSLVIWAIKRYHITISNLSIVWKKKKQL